MPRPEGIPESAWTAACEELFLKCKARYPNFVFTTYRASTEERELRVLYRFTRGGATYQNVLGGEMNYETKKIQDVKLSERNVRLMLECAERDMDMIEGKDV